jgi:hypothetical protein
MICPYCNKNRALFSFPKLVTYYNKPTGERVVYEYTRNKCKYCIKKYNRDRYVTKGLYIKKGHEQVIKQTK